MNFNILQRFKPISISLSPNVQKDDVKLAVKLNFQPWRWKKGKNIKEFEDQFKKYLGVKYAFSFNSGRSSFFAILKALNLPEGSDVLLQAFTCNAVPNPILWAGFNPVYIDCANNFNIDAEGLKEIIKDRYYNPDGRQNYSTRVLVVQHTFGLPANMDEIMAVAKEHNLIVIEDCAHALGAHFHTPEYESKKVGTAGKAAFFSFSRDKVISCVYGGIAVTNDDTIAKNLEGLQKEFGMPSLYWIRQQLTHPILLHYIILPLYKFFDLGKLFLIFSQFLHILSKAVSWKEKKGIKPQYFPRALPNALAILAYHQFNKLDTFNNHRQQLADLYYQALANSKFILPENEGIFLRFAVQHPKAHEIIYEAWHKENILLGDWYTIPIAPDDTSIKEMKYEMGSCPNAEKLAKETLNLPTHINISLRPRSGQAISDAQRIVNFLSRWK